MSKAARDWIGEETSTQLVRLKNRLNIPARDLNPEMDLYGRAERALDSAVLASNNARGALQLARARISTLQNIDQDAPDAAMRSMELMVYAVETCFDMVDQMNRAHDLCIASMLAELSSALEVDAE